MLVYLVFSISPFQEFDLLYYSLSSARTFFQKETTTQDDDTIKSEAGVTSNFQA
jgi:hypothetical protein